MKKRVMTVVAATLSVAALSAFAQEAVQTPAKAEEKPAATEKAQPQEAALAKPAAAKAEKLFGVVQSVDEKAQKIVVQTRKGGSGEFVVGEKTKLTKGGGNKAIKLSDIKDADKVFIRLSGEEVEEVHVNVHAKKKSEEPEKS